MTLTLPEGYTPPESARPGEPFDVVATIKANEDGSFELTAIDGVEVGSEEQEEEPDEMAKFVKKVGPMPWDQPAPSY